MITLTNGRIQSPANVPVANGSIEFILNIDATVIASPNGQVVSSEPITFRLDANGNLLGTCQIWSNAELNPQNVNGLGTWYNVTIFDQNNARLNTSAFQWQFTQAANSTVDIGTMTSSSQSTIFYPVPQTFVIGAPGSVISVANFISATSLAARRVYYNVINTTGGSGVVTISAAAGTFPVNAGGMVARLTATRVNSPGVDQFTTVASRDSNTQLTLTDAVANSDNAVTLQLWPAGTDDTVALNAAMAACVQPFNTLYFPAGVYVYNTGTFATWNNAAITFKGDGPAQSFLSAVNASVSTTVLNTPALPGWLTLDNIQVIGPSQGTATIVTAWSVAGGVATFTATNSLVAGQVVLTQGGIGTGNIFNNLKFTVLASGLSGSSFQANTSLGSGSGTDTFVATLDNCCLIAPTGGMKYLKTNRVEISYFPGSGIEAYGPFVSSFRDTTVHHCGAGFNMINGAVSGGGTTQHFDEAWAYKCAKAGFYLQGEATSKLDSCAVDRCGMGYYADGLKAVAFDSCDGEQEEYHNAAYPGYALYLHGAKSTIVDGFYATSRSISDARSTHLVADNSTARVVINGWVCDNGPSPVLPTNAFSFDSTCSSINMWDFSFGSISSSAFVDNSTNSLRYRAGSFGTPITGSGGLVITAGASTFSGTVTVNSGNLTTLNGGLVVSGSATGNGSKLAAINGGLIASANNDILYGLYSGPTVVNVGAFTGTSYRAFQGAAVNASFTGTPSFTVDFNADGTCTAGTNNYAFRAGGTNPSLFNAVTCTTLTFTKTGTINITNSPVVTATNFAISGGWGATPTGPTVQSPSYNAGGRVNVVPGGAGIVANPTITFTYAADTNGNTPLFRVQNENPSVSDTGQWVVSSINASTAVVTYLGLPVSGRTYAINWDMDFRG